MKEYINLSQYGDDTKNRKYYTVAESFCHPAKMSWALTCWIVDNYCDPKKSEVILDPMAGVGSTLVVGMMRRPQSIWLGVEFEDKFVKLCQANIRKVEKIAEKSMFMEVGKSVVIQGDARSLEEALGKIISSPPFTSHVDKIITSPPFTSHQEASPQILKEKYRKSWAEKVSKENLGNVKDYGSVDKIITSPPFAEAQSGGGIAKKGYQDSKHSPIDLVGKRSYMPENVGDKDNISNLKYGQVNKIVTSPPYEEGIGHGGKRAKKIGREKGIWTQGVGSYSQDKDNIGEARGKNYLSEMLRVYRECWKVLVPGGLCILVLKDFIRKGERIPLGEHTVELCKKAGFTHIRTHYRKIKNPSFWRTLQVQKYGEKYRIDHEDILVFRK